MDPENGARAVLKASQKAPFKTLRPGSGGGQWLESRVPVYCSLVKLQFSGTGLALRLPFPFPAAWPASRRGVPQRKPHSQKGKQLSPCGKLPVGKGPFCSSRWLGLSLPLGFSRHGVARREHLLSRALPGPFVLSGQPSSLTRPQQTRPGMLPQVRALTALLCAEERSASWTRADK